MYLLLTALVVNRYHYHLTIVLIVAVDNFVHGGNICLRPDLHSLSVKGNDHVLMEDEEDIEWATAVVPAAEGEEKMLVDK